VSCNLSSTGILVTRATHQAEPLCNLIKAQGGHVIHFPVLEIQPLKPDTFTASTNSSDIIIFISPNAVHCGLAALNSRSQLHNKLIAAVGRATARTLETEGVTVDILPQGSADSETLLQHTQLQQVEGKSIVIVRGEGGRPLLGETLSARGAQLSYAEVYRRICPSTDSSALLKQWHKIDVITSTSIDMLNNLVTLLGDKALPQLKSTPLLVISPRMQQQAKALGFQQIILADGASDPAILAALCKWRQE
jgi:uroporphyrinogen-III synthase